MARPIIAALGFRAHTGWAAVVAVMPQWEVVERRRISYEPEATRFIYHRATEVACNEAEALIGTARTQASDRVRKEIQDLASALSDRGIAVVAACMQGGNARLPTSLPEILAAHSRIHAAEGAFYRDVLADGCAQIGLPVSRVPAPDLLAVASKTLACNEDKLRERLATLGKQLGPPWGEDQKLATLAALIALNTRTAEAKV
jgi:Holliday junction resolvase